jgi:hypothetical protein
MMDSNPLVGRIYARSEAQSGPSIAPAAWPGPGWRQLGLISPDLAIADGDEILAIIDVDHSSPRASLRGGLPSRVDELHFHGYQPAPPSWLGELAELSPASVALAALPAPADLQLLAGCGRSLARLALGRRGTHGARAIGELDFLASLPSLHSLELWGIDLRGSPALSVPLAVERLVAGLVPVLDSSAGPWHGLEWLGHFPRVRTLVLAVPGIDPGSLANIAALPALDSLDLSGCHVTADAVAAWRSMRELRLVGADVDVSALGAIARLPSLAVLALGDVELGEAELDALAPAPALEDFAVDAGTIAADIGRLASSSLRHVRLPGCVLDDGALAGLAGFGGLRTLDLQYTVADDAAASAAAAMPKLAELSLEGCERASLRPAITATGAFAALGSLDISATRADAGVLRALASLPRLETLVATDLRAVSRDEELWFAPSLRVLQLDRTPLPSGVARAIAACPQLRKLSLRSCPLDEGQLAPLATLTAVHSLALTPRAGLPEWLAEMPELQALALEDATLTGDRLGGLESLASLVRLELRNCRLERGAWAELAELAELAVLALPGTGLPDGEVLRPLPAGLRELDASSSKLDDGDIAAMRGPALERFAFFQTRITPAGLLGIGDVPKLDSLQGVLAPVSEGVREAIVAKFLACWSLMDYMSAGRKRQDAA